MYQVEEFFSPKLLPVLSFSFLLVALSLAVTGRRLGGPPLCYRSCGTCLARWEESRKLADGQVRPLARLDRLAAAHIQARQPHAPTHVPLGRLTGMPRPSGLGRRFCWSIGADRSPWPLSLSAISCRPCPRSSKGASAAAMSTGGRCWGTTLWRRWTALPQGLSLTHPLTHILTLGHPRPHPSPTLPPPPGSLPPPSPLNRAPSGVAAPVHVRHRRHGRVHGVAHR